MTLPGVFWAVVVVFTVVVVAVPAGRTIVLFVVAALVLAVGAIADALGEAVTAAVARGFTSGAGAAVALALTTGGRATGSAAAGTEGLATICQMIIDTTRTAAAAPAAIAIKGLLLRVEGGAAFVSPLPMGVRTGGKGVFPNPAGMDGKGGRKGGTGPKPDASRTLGPVRLMGDMSI